MFMVAADSTRPVLKDAPCLANVSFGLSGLQNGLMHFFAYCFSFGAIFSAAFVKKSSIKCRATGLHALENMHVQNWMEENFHFV